MKGTVGMLASAGWLLGSVGLLGRRVPSVGRVARGGQVAWVSIYTYRYIDTNAFYVLMLLLIELSTNVDISINFDIDMYQNR